MGPVIRITFYLSCLYRFTTHLLIPDGDQTPAGTGCPLSMFLFDEFFYALNSRWSLTSGVGFASMKFAQTQYDVVYIPKIFLDIPNVRKARLL
jgi:hypothetical protein